MPDITKGYTFTDSKADWASEKETAIRLNKMVDDAKVNIVAGTGVTVARTNGNIVVSATSGSGTVTNVSVVTANGVSGTVANPTTTPAITLALGAITPTSVAASGSVTGSNLSGTNTGDQTITLTGDVTGSGTGSFAATIGNSKVTYAKIQNVSATDKVLGRSSAGAGVVEEITCTAAGRALIDDADASAQRTTLGLGTLATQNGTFSGTSSGTNTGDQTITLTGDVTGSGTGSFAATIASNAVTNTKLADMAASTIKGRQAGSTGDPEDLTGTQATALLDNFTSSLKGLVPSPAGSTRKYLRSDATWVDAPVYNVKDYGALGNDTGNDAAAINSAIADINTAGYGCLYFPQGIYVVSSALTTITASCSVIGTGVSSTEIKLTVSGFKFDFSGTANSKTARVSDMKLTRTSGSSLVGIEYVPTTDLNARHRFDFSHLNLFEWNTAIYINSGAQNRVQSGFISYCHINGDGTRANSPYGIRLKNATGVKISGCWFISVGKCISVEDNGESVSALDCSAAAVDYFFFADQDGSGFVRADHRIVDCYMAVDVRGITIGDTDGISYCVISNNVVATQINTAEAIRVKGDYTTITGNTIWPDKGSSPAVTIKVVGGNNNLVSSNIIQDKAIVLESGTTNCRVVANTYKNVTGAFVTDSGTTNRCDEPVGEQYVKTLTGGAATENVDFDLSSFGLSKVPKYVSAVISGTHGASKIMCTYDYTSASSTSTNARCVAWMTDGTNLPAGNRRFNVAVIP